MRIIIVGCGRVGSALAYQLYKKGNQVVVIDKDYSAFDNLPLDFHGRTIEGDVLAQNVLHRAEIEAADAIATVTNSDTLNALVAHIARSEYHVSKVVARNFDPAQRPLQEAFDIPIIGSTGLGAQRIEELLSNEPLRHIFVDSNMNLALYQLEVPESWNKHRFAEFLPEGKFKVVEIIRAGKSLVVSDAQIVESGDLIYLYTDPEGIEDLEGQLGISREKLT